MRRAVFWGAFCLLSFFLRGQCPTSVNVQNVAQTCQSATVYDLSFTLNGVPTSNADGNFNGFVIIAPGYQVQTCYDPSLITGFPCPLFFDPICACNGVEYSNGCFAGEAGFDASGTCGEASFTIPNILSGLGLNMTIRVRYGAAFCDIPYTFPAFSCGCANPPAASIVGPSDVCTGASNVFTALATDGTPNYSFQWNTGETTATVTKAFSSPALMTVTATDAAGCKATATHEIVSIYGPPTVSFSANVNGLSVAFGASGTNFNSVFWTFGDGQTSSQNGATHLYSASGSYPVCVTATGNCGTAQSCQNVAVSGGGPTTCPTLVENTNDSGPNSLRAAIDCANQDPGPDTIRFLIAGAGPHVIAPISPLPTLMDDATVIDGTTQPTGRIILDGSAVVISPTLGLLYGELASGLEFYGLVFRGSTAPGLRLHRCENFQVGAAGKGLTFYDNCGDCGSPTDDGTNAIIWGGQNGKVQGNRFGIDENDQKPASNPAFSCTISGQNLLIGGDRAAGEGNFFGNAPRAQLGFWGDMGISLVTDQVAVFGNEIGTGPLGTENFGSPSGHGIHLETTLGGVQIGDDSPGHANVIKNCSVGVFHNGAGSTGNLLGNQISCNGGAGIGGTSGWSTTAAPAFSFQNQTTIGGTSAPSARVDVYENDDSNCLGSPCQGAFFLGSAAADAAGGWAFSSLAFVLGKKYTATATAADGKTSAFSACEISKNSTCASVVTSTADAGAGSFRAAIDCANLRAGPDTIRFDIPNAGPHVIQLLSPLPPIVDDSLMIDATTQPNFLLGKVVLDGANMTSNFPAITAANPAGFSGLKVYGLVFRNIPGAALNVFQAQNVEIGAAGKGNVFYANSSQVPPLGAVQIVLQEVEKGHFKNNIVGLKEDFSAAPASNSITGLGGEIRNFLIGGDRSKGEGNTFCNSGHAVNLWDNPNGFAATAVDVFGNDFGFAPNGTPFSNATTSVNVPNGSAGRIIRIGDGSVDRANRFGHSTTGVFVDPTAGVSISRNEFFCNSVGIETQAVAAPTITAATAQAISGTANAGARIEIFAHQPCGNVKCQGKTWLGWALADGSGAWILAAPFSATLAAGDSLTATATIFGNTSPFSCPGFSFVGCAAFSMAATAFDPTCDGSSDGSIALNLVGGGGPFSFDWNQNALDGQQNPTGLGAGFFAVTASDAAGCTATATVNLTAPPLLAFSNLMENCAADNQSFSVSFEISGGTPPYSINAVPITGGSFLSGFLPSGTTYSFLIKDKNGCETAVSGLKNCACSTVPAAQITFSAADFCKGSTLQLDETGGAATGWKWAGPNGFSSVLKNPTVVLTSSGAFSVTVTEAAGCQNSASKSATVEPLPAAKAEADPKILCFGKPLFLEETGGATGAKWAWSGPNGFASTDQNPTVAQPATGNYSVKVTSAAGCSATDDVAIVVFSKIETLLDSMLIKGQTILFGGETIEKAGVFVDSLVSAAGCDSLVRLTVFVDSGPAPTDCIESAKAKMPTAIFLGGSPANAFFDPFSIFETEGCPFEKAESRLFIFERGGEIVWKNRDEYEAFDGGGLPTGAYFFQLNMVFSNGSAARVRGPVNLFRPNK